MSQKDTVLGALLSTVGPITAVLVYSSPIPVLRSIIKNKTTNELPLLPYIFMFLSAGFWIAYSYLIDAVSLVIANAFGLILATFYITGFAMNAKYPKNVKRLILFLFVFLGYGFILLFLPSLRNIRETVLGWTALFCRSGLQAAPLVLIGHVLKTKTVAALPLGLSLMTFINSFVWACYGVLVVDDTLVIASNVFGLTVSFLQLLCHLIYGNHCQQTKTEPTTKPNSLKNTKSAKEMSKTDFEMEIA